MKQVIETVKSKDGRRKYKVICTECGYQSQVRVSTYDKDAVCKRCDTTKRNEEGRGSGVKDHPISKSFLYYFKSGAKRRGVLFQVSLDYARSLWTGKCALSEMEITAPSFTHNGNCVKGYTTASLDRIDSYKGYIEGNVQWVNKHINIMKNGYSQEEFVYMCHMVASSNANQQPSVLKGNRKVNTKVQRLEGEEIQPITPPRVPNTPTRGDDIVRYSLEMRRV